MAGFNGDGVEKKMVYSRSGELVAELITLVSPEDVKEGSVLSSSSSRQVLEMIVFFCRACNDCPYTLDASGHGNYGISCTV